MIRTAESEIIARRSAESIAGGVVSLNRKVDPPLVFVRAQGSRLWDADGNEYIDYHAAFAPHLLGHNDPGVNGAVREAMERGWSLMGSGPTPWEMAFAELLRRAVPTVESVQLANTGSEATAHAIRLSRAFTGREDILLTLGGYNGWHNDVARTVMPSLDDIGPRVSPGEYRFLPLSAGIPSGVTRRVHIVNFNDPDSVEYVMKRHPVACVLTEPVLQNIGVVPPRPGYLAALRDLCDRHGSVLVFDEVKTGFRSAPGGYQSIAGVTPDLSVFGKAVANGYPLGVIGGKKEIMRLFDAKGRAVRVSRIGSAFCVYFCDRVPSDWHELAARHDFAFDQRYRRALIERGVYHFPLPCKQGSISAAHTEADIDRTLEITKDVLAIYS